MRAETAAAPLKNWRSSRRWSLARAAKHFRVHPVTYWRWETYRVVPHGRQLRRVARALHQPVAAVENDFAAKVRGQEATAGA